MGSLRNLRNRRISVLMMKNLLEKIISGGQTGVDRAALDAAIRLGIPCGGWCPQGRKAEDGRIPDHYPLHEASSPDYPVRTRLNVFNYSS